jgi:hypothetical protein
MDISEAGARMGPIRPAAVEEEDEDEAVMVLAVVLAARRARSFARCSFSRWWTR